MFCPVTLLCGLKCWTFLFSLQSDASVQLSDVTLLSSLSHRYDLTFVMALQVDQRWNETALHPSSVTFRQTERRIKKKKKAHEALTTCLMSVLHLKNSVINNTWYPTSRLDFQNKACWQTLCTVRHILTHGRCKQSCLVSLVRVGTGLPVWRRPLMHAVWRGFRRK